MQLLYRLHSSKGGPESPEDSGEVGVFQCAPFSGPNYTPGSWAEASDRLVYTALNTRRVDMGNPMFGDVSIVFSRANVSAMTLIAPIDTGLYEMGCNQSGLLRPTVPTVSERQRSPLLSIGLRSQQCANAVPLQPAAVAACTGQCGALVCWKGALPRVSQPLWPHCAIDPLQGQRRSHARSAR